MARQIVRWTLRATAVPAVLGVLAWGVLHVAAAIALLVLVGFVYTATLPLHEDLVAARRRRIPQPRLELADTQVDWEFQRIVDGERSRD